MKESLEQQATKLEEFLNHPGYEIYLSIIGGLIEKENQALRTLKLDNEYYRRIGFDRAIKYLSELKTILKDKKTREFLLHQGTALGFDYASKTLQQEAIKRRQIVEETKKLKNTAVPSREEASKFFEQQNV